jgi:hypothetical protein
MITSCEKEDFSKKESSWIKNQNQWFSYDGIISSNFTTDNDTNTYGYMELSQYDIIYTGNIYVNFDEAKNIDGFGLKYSVRNTDSNYCFNYYSGSIAHIYSCILYYADGPFWIKVDSNELKHSGLECQISDSLLQTFTSIKSKYWKITFIGNFWLGGWAQDITEYRIYEVFFRED